MQRRSSIIVLILSFGAVALCTNCGGEGSNIDLSGETSTINQKYTNAAAPIEESEPTFTSETVEDSEVVQSAEAGESGDSNADTAIDAPELGYVTDALVYIDCSLKTAEGDPDADYVALSCTQGESTIEYLYYCTTSTDTEGNEIFIVTRDTDDDPVVTDELFETILVTCQEADDGSPELFEEEYIVS